MFAGGFNYEMYIYIYQSSRMQIPKIQLSFLVE